MRAFFLSACAIALAACEPSPSAADSDSADAGETVVAQNDAPPVADPAADDGATSDAAAEPADDDGASADAEPAGLPAAFEDANIANGRQNWFLCAACHQIADGASHSVGPDLHAVFGSTAGANPTFPLYSPALKDSGIVWTPETLDTWIANPRDVLPSTTMIFPGIRDEEDRRDLIAYLWEEAGSAEGEE